MGQNHSNDFWSRLQSRLGTCHPGATEGVSFDTTAKLTLPKVGVLKKAASSADGLEKETYENFARHAERQNPNTEFTKDLLDAAFQKAVSRLPSQVSMKGRVNELLARVSLQTLLSFLCGVCLLIVALL